MYFSVSASETYKLDLILWVYCCIKKEKVTMITMIIFMPNKNLESSLHQMSAHGDSRSRRRLSGLCQRQSQHGASAGQKQLQSKHDAIGQELRNGSGKIYIL